MEGALAPNAYVARAYKEARHHNGSPPRWAKKQGNGHWLFDKEYIEADARTNSSTIGIDEAAGLLGATRRAVQTWVDHGTIAAIAGTDRTKGARRRIMRAKFMHDLPELRKRLETPAVLGYKRNRPAQHAAPVTGPVPPVVPRLESRPPPTAIVQEQKDATGPAIMGSRDAHDLSHRAGARPDSTETAGKEETLTPALPAVHEPDQGRLAKEQAVNALEAMLREARDTKRKEAELESQATKIAEKLLDDMFGESLTRVDALVMFNNLATDRGIPADIRTRIRRQYFGR